MPLEIICRIVRGTDCLYIESPDKGLATELLRSELFVTFFEYVTSSLGAEDLVDPEHPFKFKVGPVIKRIPHKIRHGLSPFAEGFPRRCASSGDIFFINSVRPHGSPLVMVARLAVYDP